MSFDIAKQDYSKAAELGYTFGLKLPTGADSGAKLVVIGDLSPTVKQYGKRKYAEWQQKMAIAKRKGRDAEEMDLDEAEALSVEAALVRLVGWSGIKEDGKEVPFTKEKATEVLTQHAWIRDAIMQEAADLLNFQPKTAAA